MEIRARYSLVASGLVAGSVWVNALWLQEGRHPAPLFAAAPPPATAPIAPHPENLPMLTPANAPLSADLQPAPALPQQSAAARQAGERLVGERLAMLQRALFEMGFYDGPVDGIDGPRTQFAVLSYQKAHGLAANAIADEGLLAHARKANGKGLAAARPEPLTADQRHIRAVQLVLEKLGYMRGSATGNMDDETRNAIARFQRDHGLAVTGEMSGPLVRQLSAASGVPIEEGAG